MKVVFDTNVLVSAFVFPGGRADDAMRRVLGGEDELVSSRALLDELLEVLARKFSRDREELARVALFVSEAATMVRPSRRLRVLRDDADNRVLECAVAGRVAAIVTGDKALLRLTRYGTARIVSLAEYLGT